MQSDTQPVKEKEIELRHKLEKKQVINIQSSNKSQGSRIKTGSFIIGIVPNEKLATEFANQYINI